MSRQTVPCACVTHPAYARSAHAPRKTPCAPARSNSDTRPSPSARLRLRLTVTTPSVFIPPLQHAAMANGRMGLLGGVPCRGRAPGRWTALPLRTTGRLKQQSELHSLLRLFPWRLLRNYSPMDHPTSGWGCQESPMQSPMQSLQCKSLQCNGVSVLGLLSNNPDYIR
jgi:hypothetical protein